MAPCAAMTYLLW